MLDLYKKLNYRLFLDSYGKALVGKTGNPVKYFDISTDFDKFDLIKHEQKDLIIYFLLKVKDVYLIPLELPNKLIYAFQLRGVKEKKFLNIKLVDNAPLVFGLSDFNKFEYNTPIILVEGITDVMAVKIFYPFSLAYLTSQPSINLWEYLNQITTRIIFIPDNDNIGKNIKKIHKYKRMQIYYSSISKDFGEYWKTEDISHLKEIEMLLKLEKII